MDRTNTDRSIVSDCDVCHRTVWTGSVCNHGQVPEPKEKQVTPIVRTDGPVPVIPKKGKK